MAASWCAFGCRIGTGRLGDVALGFDSLDAYVAGNPFFGTITGRYANRIAGARFELDGVAYGLAQNNGAHSLHGGARGFDKVVWRGEPTDAGNGVALTYVSPDGEEGYPGALTTTVTYSWSDANELSIDYRAETDRATVVNLTNHSYFNLADGGAGSVLGHEVTIHAERYTPADDEAIPTGQIAPVAGTPFDFRRPRTLGERIDAHQSQMRSSGGYDVNYVLDGGGGGRGPGRGRRQAGAGRHGVRANERPGHGCAHRSAGGAALHRQPSRRQPSWPGRHRLRETQRVLPGDAALSQLAERAVIPIHRAASGAGLCDDHSVSLQDELR